MTYLPLLPAAARDAITRVLSEARTGCPCSAGRCTLDSLEREALEEEAARLHFRDRGRGAGREVEFYARLAREHVTVDDDGRHRVAP